MLELDPIILARMQFAANITFHILFPAISIGLGWILLFFKWRFQRTHDDKWMGAYRFWVKIFALTFALGVVSGVTMSFQFGTNWPGFMATVGNVAGPLLAYEVLTAFFLEATFLGIMLFGVDYVSDRIHTLATALVAIGTSLSAFWIMALNAWMQTPAGFEMIDGKAYVTNWMEVIFNPSFPYRVIHMLLASAFTAAFLIAGMSAYRWGRGDKVPSVLASLKTGLYLAAFLIPLQIFGGDLLGLNTLQHQPAKIAAMEGIWETERRVPLLLFALPNEKERRNDYAIGIPRLGSLILTHSWDGELKGLNEFKGKHPPVSPVFWAFRIMVGTGLLMLLISWIGSWQLWRQKGIGPYLTIGLISMTFSGWVATVSGWYVTEIGRQPYLVYNVMMTKEAVSEISVGMVGSTLLAYLVTYVLLTFAYISTLFYLARKAETTESLPISTQPGEPASTNLLSSQGDR